MYESLLNFRCSVYTYIKLRNASNIPHVIVRSFVEHILKLRLQLPIFFIYEY